MSSLVASLATRRTAIVALALAAAAAITVAVFNDRGMFGRTSDAGGDAAGLVRNGLQQGVNGVKAVGDSIANLFDARSPGQRAAGLLANMKQRKQPALHQRALPKVRRPVSPLAGIVGAAPPPVEAPLFQQPLDKVGAPGTPVAISPPGGASGIPGGPGGGFPGVSIPGGGGGGIIIPPPAVNPPVNPPVTPPVVVPPVTSGVPEPSSWAMMMLGFVLIARVTRQRRQLLSA